MHLPIKFTMTHLLTLGLLTVLMANAACSQDTATPTGTVVRKSTYTGAPVAANSKPKTIAKADTKCVTAALLDDDEEEEEEEEDDDDDNRPPTPATPAGTKPVATAPAGTTPAGTTPAGTTPAGTTPASEGAGGAIVSDESTPSPSIKRCPVVVVPTPVTPEPATGDVAEVLPETTGTTPASTPTGATPPSETSTPVATPSTPVPTPATPATSPPVAQLDGAALYATNCQSCHRALGSSDVRGDSAGSIKSAIANVGAMRNVRLSDAVIAAIAAALR